MLRLWILVSVPKVKGSKERKKTGTGLKPNFQFQTKPRIDDYGFPKVFFLISIGLWPVIFLKTM